MARPRQTPAEEEYVPADDAEAERLAREREGDPEPEVRPEELAAGIAAPVGASAFADEVVEELRKPLDPNRVRTRSGRGGGSFEYLAGHDVKRRANEIFGFGRWGHRVVEQAELGAVEVESDRGKRGWHVAYRCVVEVWIGHPGEFVTQGSGYGDATEYTPAARVTASELALKESETDALKRAFTDLGDQFGLILYAKEDEKRRIERDRDAETATRTVERRQEEAGRPTGKPQSWGEIRARFARVLGGTADDEAAAEWWLGEVVSTKYGIPTADLDRGQKQEAFVVCASGVMALEEEHADLAFTEGRVARGAVGLAYAALLDGVKLEGPPWRLGPDELDRPTREEWAAENASKAEEPAPAAAE